MFRQQQNKTKNKTKQQQQQNKTKNTLFENVCNPLLEHPTLINVECISCHFREMNVNVFSGSMSPQR